MVWGAVIRVGGVAACSDPMDAAKNQLAPNATRPRPDDFAGDRPHCCWKRLAGPSRIRSQAMVLCLASAVVRRRPSRGLSKCKIPTGFASVVGETKNQETPLLIRWVCKQFYEAV